MQPLNFKIGIGSASPYRLRSEQRDLQTARWRRDYGFDYAGSSQDSPSACPPGSHCVCAGKANACAATLSVGASATGTYGEDYERRNVIYSDVDHANDYEMETCDVSGPDLVSGSDCGFGFGGHDTGNAWPEDRDPSAWEADTVST